MWTCTICTQQFLRTNQAHSCLDKTEQDFLRGKSEKTLALYHHFLDQVRTIGDFRIHPSKSMLSLAKNTRFCMIYRLGRNFLDVYLPLNNVYDNTLCFHKIGQLGGKQTNHWLRIYEPEDVNEEVLYYLKMAYDADAEKGTNYSAKEEK